MPITHRYARASIAKVMCRYQPSYRRTSYWSRPTCPLASSKHSSMAYWTPAEVFFGNPEVVGESTSNRRWAQEPGLATNLRPAELSLNSASNLSN